MNRKNTFGSRIGLFLMLLVIMAICRPFHAYADPETKGTCGDHVTWEYKDKTLVIRGKGAMKDYTYDDYGTINSTLPWHNLAFTRLIVEEGVTRIGSVAFGMSTDLETVTLPDTIDEIGEAAFMGCEKLESIKMPKTIKSIEMKAFDCCWNLTSLYLPDGLTVATQQMCTGANNLKDVRFPDTLQKIE